MFREKSLDCRYRRMIGNGISVEGSILMTRGIIWNVEINPGCYPGFFFLVKRYYPGFISWPADDLKKELYKFTGCHGC